MAAAIGLGSWVTLGQRLGVWGGDVAPGAAVRAREVGGAVAWEDEGFGEFAAPGAAGLFGAAGLAVGHGKGAEGGG